VEADYKFLRKDISIDNIGGRFAEIFSQIDEKKLFEVVDDISNAGFFYKIFNRNRCS